MIYASNPGDLEHLVYLLDTAIGKGVFAKRFFDVGDTIALLTGTLIEDPTYDSHYCIEMGPELSLEPDPPFRFINHSCNPNCRLESFVGDGDDPDFESELALTVCRTIYPGEEITIDYAWPAHSAIPCLCGEPDCRGWIVDIEEIEDVHEARRKRGWTIVEWPRCPACPNPEVIVYEPDAVQHQPEASNPAAHDFDSSHSG